MTDNLHPDLSRWLAIAVRGLPEDAAATTRAEIAAHYEDALEDYARQGMTPDEAHARTMADLGAAAIVAHGLSDVHRGGRHYARAAGASMAVFAVLFFVPVGLYALGLDTPLVEAVAITLRTALVIYVIRVLSWLLSWRLNLRGIGQAQALIFGGMIAENGAVIVSLLVYATEAYVDVTRTLSSADGLLPLLIPLAAQAGRLASSAGMIWIAWELFPAKDGLYGLGKPLAVITGLLGLFLAGACLLPYFSLDIALGSSIGVMAMHVMIWPLLTLLFFRVAYRSPVHPVQTA